MMNESSAENHPTTLTGGSGRATVNTAFALGGFAGKNYHGLGFLQGALDKYNDYLKDRRENPEKYKQYPDRIYLPDMISCTSGQIYFVWYYILALNSIHGGKPGLPNGIRNLEDIALNKPTHPIKTPGPAFLGIHEISSMVGDLIKKVGDVETLQHNPVGYMMNALLNTYPAKIGTPALNSDDCKSISDTFNAEDNIGIIFNSYDPVNGSEHVYLNDRARDVLQRTGGTQTTFRKSRQHETTYFRISPSAVEEALWLYEYGFENRQHVDGSYFRQIMLSEVSRAKKIYVVRPVNYRWIGDLPRTYGDKEALKTEIFFNAAYYGELFRIEYINRLLRQNALDKAYEIKEGYHPIEIVEVEIETQKGYISLFSEDMETFKFAREEAARVIKWP